MEENRKKVLVVALAISLILNIVALLFLNNYIYKARVIEWESLHEAYSNLDLLKELLSQLSRTEDKDFKTKLVSDCIWQVFRYDDAIKTAHFVSSTMPEEVRLFFRCILKTGLDEQVRGRIEDLDFEALDRILDIVLSEMNQFLSNNDRPTKRIPRRDYASLAEAIKNRLVQEGLAGYFNWDFKSGPK